MGSRAAYFEIEWASERVPHDMFGVDPSMVKEVPSDHADRRRFQFSYLAKDEIERDHIAARIFSVALDAVINGAETAKH